MTNEKLICEFKLAALHRLSELGMTPDELGELAKRAATQSVKQGGGLPITVSPRGIIDGLGKALLLAVGLTSGLGAGVGYVGQEIFGDRKQDVDEAREKQRIDVLRRATIRTNAESRANRDDKDDKRRRPQALEILSAV